MILSQRQLEEIAASTTKDFNRFFFGDEADKPDRSALPTPIDQFAKNYLGLRVSFACLSPDGSICGVTAYADTEYKITELGITRTLALKRNQVILDKCLTSAESKAAYEKILEYVLKNTGLKVSHLYIFQAKQEYGTIERGIHLAEIRKRQVALMPI